MAGGTHLAQALQQPVWRRGGRDQHAAGLQIDVFRGQLPDAVAGKEREEREEEESLVVRSRMLAFESIGIVCGVLRQAGADVAC